MSDPFRASFSMEIKPESDELFIPIPEDLGPTTWPELCIYRVPRRLRSVNPSAYTPILVSIGPLHHGNKQFQAMETQKLRYLRDFCKRTGMTSSQLAVLIKEKEVTIRRCYEEASKLCSKNFIRMILLDSVFIIELFLKKLYGNEDYISSNPRMSNDLLRDLIILENQLPWFILEDLYNFSFAHKENRSSFIVLTEVYFSKFRWREYDLSDQKQNKLFEDCGFSLLHGHWIKRICPRSRKIVKEQSGAETNKKPPEEIPEGFQRDSIIRDSKVIIEELEVAQQKKYSRLHFVDVIRRVIASGLESSKRSKEGITKLYNATKLHGAGVKFKLSSRESPRLGITFNAGVLSMAVFEVQDLSECIYRNLMAFEQCHLPYHSYVCDFLVFLDYLIDSEKDVDLLVQSGVIRNLLGESRAVSRMVNKLCKEITFTGSLYYNQSEKLNAHADNRWNRSMATLKSVYFANLWRGTGTVAAVVLLALAFIQTFYAFK